MRFDFNNMGGPGGFGGGSGYNPGNQNFTPNKPDFTEIKKKTKKVLFVVFGAIIIAFAGLNSFYTLKEDQVAVITTLGKPEAHTKSGLNFKIPFIQTVHKLSKNIRGMAIGFDSSHRQDSDYVEDEAVSISEESEMITKDFNFVNVDFYIEYQITDPIQAFIYNDSANEIVKNLAQSYIRDTVGVYNVDDVITTGKAEIQAKVKEKLSQRLLEENIGFGIVNVTLQDAEPPTEEVSNAFKAVEDAKQSMDTAINQAKKYQSEQIPAANAEADKLMQNANAYKQQRISEAEGQAARFNEMYNEYVKYPLITKKRMFYETMEDILPELKVIIDNGSGTQTLLPLESFSSVPEAEEKPAANNNTEGAE